MFIYRMKWYFLSQWVTPTPVIMAMMDNANFLLAHIRNSFITSDDTGMCELIIENDESERETKKVSRYDSDITHFYKCSL